MVSMKTIVGSVEEIRYDSGSLFNGQRVDLVINGKPVVYPKVKDFAASVGDQVAVAGELSKGGILNATAYANASKGTHGTASWYLDRYRLIGGGIFTFMFVLVFEDASVDSTQKLFYFVLGPILLLFATVRSLRRRKALKKCLDLLRQSQKSEQLP